MSYLQNLPGSSPPVMPPAQPSPASIQAPVTIDYPYILTGKLQMTLFTPDRTRALFTVLYPDTWSWSWSKSRNLSILRDGSTVGRAAFHSFTTEKVDAWFSERYYHFKKRFESQTGLSAAPWKKMLWDVSNGELMLTPDDETGPILARFVPKDAIGLGGATNLLEGRLELRAMGLTDAQFEELFVTLVAEMERKRRTNEEWAVAAAVMGG
ncbi:hypothetical protein B0H67DRAFT_572396 [Lasiosphaeris hirsuta]|uniref:Uncharacterized protein n=1 Tax=Lasiosphaeris hirsuta TaxID=260670 RepID=A0AA40B1Y7_9PEZI|nr:hypothetical protein B0H67DRAFT_572396 [Lasiosphaeris hirsuta]